MTSHAKKAPPTVAQNGGRLGPSREELAELERELDVYLTFWAHARDGRGHRGRGGDRE